ncbi:MAG TPA: type II toxin-antitoxin system HicB family antitoxin [Candidatus Bariatricus faecipullorum]|nr:type II toxin-antitoxin system HicB family antitoxin [Candidatus Bariatricus faecipullorum]
MKTLNDYMAMSYRMEIIEDKEEGGFVVSYPDLPGCVTCGETVENYSGQFKLRIPRSLHRLLAEHSQREGISMNQYCVYLLSRNDAIFSK